MELRKNLKVFKDKQGKYTAVRSRKAVLLCYSQMQPLLVRLHGRDILLLQLCAKHLVTTSFFVCPTAVLEQGASIRGCHYFLKAFPFLISKLVHVQEKMGQGVTFYHFLLILLKLCEDYSIFSSSFMMKKQIVVVIFLLREKEINQGVCRLEALQSYF